MAALSQTELAIRNIQRGDGNSPDRYVDMQIGVYRPDDERPSFRVGGRWDTQDRRYDGPAETECAIRLTPAQVLGWDIARAWLTKYIAARVALRDGAVATIDEALDLAWGSRDPLFTLQLYGGRQGGKTHLGAVLVALVCVAIPGARTATISTTKEKHDELEAILEQFCVPSEWRRTVGRKMTFVNGSEIKYYTGSVTDLKALGPIEIGLLNEAQEQKVTNWTDLQGNTLARAGLVVLAQNPPRSNRGAWTQKLFSDVKAGNQPGADVAWCNPRLNPHASNKALQHLGSTMDEKTRRRDIDGDMGVATGDTALDAWSDSLHVIGWIPTTWVDITPEFTRSQFGQPYSQVGGLDWDKGAGPSFCIGRIFRPHSAPDWAAILVIEHGQRFPVMPESKFPGHLLTMVDKYGSTLAHPATTIWVGDSSGRTQSTERKWTEDDHPSWQRMQAAGWQVTYVDPIQKRNPRRADRFDLINHFVLAIQPVAKQPRVVMLADTASRIIEASRNLPRYKLEASRRNEHAHEVDTWTYLAWRLFSKEFQDFTSGVPEVVARHIPRGVLG